MRKIAVVWIGLVVGGLLWTVPSQAALLDPLAFTSLGTLNTTDIISINTDTLQLTGGASYTGVLDPVSGAGIFTFDDISGTNLSIFGTRTLGLLSRGSISFAGTIDLLGSGGLEMVAVGSLALHNLNAGGSGGGDIQLEANQFSLTGAVTVVNRSISVTSATDIVLPGGPGVPRIIPSPGPIIFPGGGTPSVIFTRPDAPVPLPAALPLFAVGLGFVTLALRRWRAR